MESHNWAGNYVYRATGQHYPKTVEQVQEIVVRSQSIKPLGTRHCFNEIADTTGEHISLANMDSILALNTDHSTVTVEAGIRYGALCQWLDRQGYALPNLASLPHISIAGAVSTGTHGSGDANGSLSTAVSALELVTADGSRKTFSREADRDCFSGLVVGLGAFGVVITLTLDIIPTYNVRQDVYENLSLNAVTTHFEEIISSAYSVSLFTQWNSPEFYQVWRKHRLNGDTESTPEQNWFGATLASHPVHPIVGLPAEYCTEQGVPGPWYARLPHFRLDYTPSSGEELQSEYLLPRQHAVDALLALNTMREEIAPHLQLSEIRTIAADSLWMSPCYGQDCVGIHFTWKKDWPSVEKLLPRIEAVLYPYQARPHWGKLFTLSPDLLWELYPQFPTFRELVEKFDPQQKFSNTFLANLFKDKIAATA